ncbi:MAG: hypothetical protein ACF8OB_04660 [Phycisphaeraceae bacterium JB051]
MILMSVILGMCLNAMLGYWLTRCFFNDAFKQVEPVSRLILIYLIGQFLGSMTYWLWLLLGVHVYGTWILLDLIVIGTLAYGASQHKNSQKNTLTQAVSLSQQQLVTWLVFAGIGWVMVWCLGWHIARLPYGGWDAAAMWNYRVSYIALPREQWLDIFKTPAAHPDYPLMHSLTAARLCALTGHWQPVVTAWLGVAHALVVLVLLLGTVMQRVGIRIAILGAMLLVASNLWWEYSSWQYADITLCCYMFASAVMFCHWFDRNDPDHHGLLYAALLLLGTCAWTKNEGWPWVIGMGVVILACLWFKPIPGKTKWLMRCTLCLLAVLWMPLTVHWMSEQGNGMVRGMVSEDVSRRLFDPQRMIMIASYYWQFLRLFYPWLITVMLLAVCLLSRYRPNSSRSRVGWLVILLFVGQLSVYLLVFMTTEHDLKWHLHTAAKRLFNQIWPLWILGCCLLAADEKTVWARERSSHALQSQPQH